MMLILEKLLTEAELKAYKKIENSVAAALNGVKGEVITVSKIRGYHSPLEETLINSRLDEKSLNAMLAARWKKVFLCLESTTKEKLKS